MTKVAVCITILELKRLLVKHENMGLSSDSMQKTGKNYLEHVAGRVGHESGRGQKKSGLDFNIVFGPLRQKNLKNKKKN